jgi:hypothetical protein
MLVAVAGKLSAVYEAGGEGGIKFKVQVGPEVVVGGVPGMQVNVDNVLSAARLTHEEIQWAKFRFELLRTAHGTMIGNPAQRSGIFGHLARVEEVLRLGS